MTSALELAGVSKSYGDTPAVRDLDLAVEQGEILALIGPSGCGKSTLLRLVAGLERPDAGTVRGRRPRSSPGRRGCRRSVAGSGWSSRSTRSSPTCGSATTSASASTAGPGRSRTPASREVLELVHLAHVVDRYPHELSGGEQQRVALARALAPRPAVVLLDEPFSSLDESLRARVRTDTVDVAARHRHHGRPRHPRPDRGPHGRRPHRRHARGRHRAARLPRSRSSSDR